MTAPAKPLAVLRPGTEVGHANPDLADWAGTVTAGPRGWARPATGDVWVLWHKGTVPARRDGSSGVPFAGWIEATAVALKSPCPDCGRPGRLLFAGNFWDLAAGWNHDA